MDLSAVLKKITQTEKANSNIAEIIIIIIVIVQGIRSDHSDKLSAISK